jgi:DNA-binding response OmpR family regulator
MVSLTDQLEAQLAAVQKRIENLQRQKATIANRLRLAKLRPKIAENLDRFSCRKVETAHRRYEILDYLDSYLTGLTSRELHEMMAEHGIRHNPNTLRVEISRLRHHGLLKKDKKTKKWLISESAQAILHEVRYGDHGATYDK